MVFGAILAGFLAFCGCVSAQTPAKTEQTTVQRTAAAAVSEETPAEAATTTSQVEETRLGSYCASGVGVVGYSDALDKASFGGTQVGGLSSLASDGSGGYLSVVDRGDGGQTRYYGLDITVDADAVSARRVVPEVTEVGYLSEGGAPLADFDGEGMVTDGVSGFVASEAAPSIGRFGDDGVLRSWLSVPAKFAVGANGSRYNAAFESLAIPPGKGRLFTAVESPLGRDGRTSNGSGRLRILSYVKSSDGRFVPGPEFYYLTAPGGSVSDIVALSGSDLLVMERSFPKDQGNVVRIFRVNLNGASSVSKVSSLATTGIKPVSKKLVVDLASCPTMGATNPGYQQNPLVDNYEGMVVGQTFPDGTRELLLLSDDNFSPRQVGRVLALRYSASRAE